MGNARLIERAREKEIKMTVRRMVMLVSETGNMKAKFAMEKHFISIIMRFLFCLVVMQFRRRFWFV